MKTVQQRIFDELKARISSLTEEDGSPLFNNVVSGAVDALAPTYWPACGVDQGQEETSDQMWPMIEKSMHVFISIRFVMRRDVDSYDKFRYYLGRLQHLLFGDTDKVTLGGLCVNVQEIASAPEIESKDDPGPGGVLTLQVTYRHKNGDPYSLLGENNG